MHYEFMLLSRATVITFCYFILNIYSFLDFMEKWNKTSRPKFMDIAWTTEKSIEDELDRTSKAEIITMVISYLVMFVYIALALGKIRFSFVGCLVSHRLFQCCKIVNKYVSKTLKL